MTDKGLTRWDPFISGRTFGYIARVVRSHSASPFLHRQGCRVSHSNNIIIHQSMPAEKDSRRVKAPRFSFIASDEVIHGVVF